MNRSALHWKSKWRLLAACVLMAAGLGKADAAPQKPATRQPSGVQADILPPASADPAKDLLLSPAEIREADAYAAYMRGLLAEDAADNERALEEYRTVLNLDPGATIRTGDADLLLALKVAGELVRRNDPAQAVNILKDAIKSSPKEPLLYLYLSQIYGRSLRKPDVALKYAQQGLELDLNNLAGYAALYEIYVSTNQQKKADQVLERASRSPSTDPEYWLQLGDLYKSLYLKEDGSSAAEDLKKVTAIYEKGLSLGQNHSAVLTKVADFYILSSKNVAAAIPLYEKALALNTKSPEFSPAHVREKLARSYIANDQRDKAIELLQQIIKENPLRNETYELLGRLYYEKGDFDKAAASFQQTILLNPNEPANYLRVGELLMSSEIKQPAKAVETLKEAREKFPGLPRITYALAIAMSQAKMHQQALTMFEEALHEAEDSQEELLNAEFYLSYGAAAEQAGLIDKAAELLKKSIELDPRNSATACNYLGFMWVDRGQNLEEAGELIRRALELEPDNGAFIDSLGWYYYKKGEYDKALAELLKAADAIQPEDAVVMDHIGDTYAKLGNTKEAIAYWQKAAQLQPENRSFSEKVENARQKVTAHSATSPAAVPEPPK
jgi:tetratricopeptide (TPR) repeat protein